MNLIDIIIILILIAALIHGVRLGMWLALAQYAGLFWGLLLGALIAPHALRALSISGPGLRAVVVACIVATTTALGSLAGFLGGLPIRNWLGGRRVLGSVDQVLGGVFSAVAAVAVAWMVAIGLGQGPNPVLASQIQQSSIVRAINRISPGAPGFVLQLEQSFSQQLGGTIFTGLEPTLPSPLPATSDNVALPGVQAAAARTYRIVGTGCGGVVTGSGFPIAPGYVLTNAHVVAGTTRTEINLPNGQTLRGTVTLFDPLRDIAVIKVPGLSATPFAFGDASRGTQGAVIGYPEGGPETIVPAAVNGSLIANGRDIFGQQAVSRDVLVISANVRPGNSGGPLVDTQGRLIGVVYAESLSQPGQGFALSLSEIEPDISALETGNPPFDHQRRYTCAS